MKKFTKSAATVAFSVVILGLFLPTAHADSQQSPEAQTSALSSAEQSVAKRYGLDLTKSQTEHVGGYTLIQDGDQWVIMNAGSTPSPSVGTTAYSAGICAGYFINPRMVAGKLEWGAWDSCSSTASPNDLYVHELKVTLRQQNPGLMRPWYVKRTVTSPTSQRFNRAITVHVTSNCDDTNSHNFHILVYPQVHSVKFSTIQSSSMSNIPCGLAS